MDEPLYCGACGAECCTCSVELRGAGLYCEATGVLAATCGCDGPRSEARS